MKDKGGGGAGGGRAPAHHRVRLTPVPRRLSAVACDGREGRKRAKVPQPECGVSQRESRGRHSPVLESRIGQKPRGRNGPGLDGEHLGEHPPQHHHAVLDYEGLPALGCPSRGI